MAASYWQPVTPVEGDLTYRGLKLKNGMIVLLVHYPTKDGEEKAPSAAALSLARGNLSDPWEFPGMAHFCEHMLFLGNDKYPIEGEYRKYLQEHGGGSNASTGPEMTLYKFRIADDYFEGGLDRFLNFFKTPLFTESATHREVLAVDSEYKRNTLSDRIRSLNLVKHLCNPEHVFCRFASGNEKSLSQIPSDNNLDLRTNLLRFYDDYYSADIMNLVVVSSRSLDDLEQMVTKEDSFSSVPSKGLTKPISLKGVPFEKQHLGRFVEYVPLQDSMILDVFVPVPQTAITSDPALRCSRLLTHILGHECEGSLSDVLRSQGLVSEVVVLSNMKESFGHLKASFVLTDKGFDQINFIVSCLCHYAALIDGEIETGCPRMHSEKKKARQLLFDYQSKKQPLPLATSLASNLRYAAKPEEAINHPYAMPPEFDDFQKKATRACLHLFKPESMLILLGNPELKKSGRATETEPWWDVKYTARDLTDEEKTKMSKTPDVPMRLPEENHWLPSNTDILPLGAGETNPEEIVISDNTRIWWKENCKFSTPKCKVKVLLHSPSLSSTAAGCATGEVTAALFVHAMSSKYYYSEEVSHNEIHFEKSHSRLSVSVTGFADVAVRLSKSLTSDLLKVPFDENSFNLVKEKLCRDYTNTNLKNASIQAARAMKELLVPSPGHNDIHEALKQLSFSQFNSLLDTIRSTSSAELISFGNLPREMAAELGKHISELICNKVEFCRPVLQKVVRLPQEGSGLREYLCLHYSPNPTNKESAVAVRYQFGQFSFKLAARVIILRSLLAPRFFTTLRTQEQLGYGVSSAYHNLKEVLYLQLNVRSSTDPVKVHERIDVFLKNFHKDLIAMSESVIEDCVASTKSTYAAPNSNLFDEFSELATEISRQSYCWDRRRLMLDELSCVSHSDIVSLFETFIRPSSWSDPKCRSVVSVYSLTDAHADAFKSRDTSVRAVDDDASAQVCKIDAEDIACWRDGMGFFDRSVQV
eukprot:TRINITY_DN20580_c0_g1_i1.p1 TRINITY_DN20580_c0_g1~~TRINITY_DN20580_c0_g1_i1.p1  ORF type:complete len:1000 (+),score=128.47 TRINITY_DN20580_c0_g1_i1:46-3000(+)